MEIEIVSQEFVAECKIFLRTPDSDLQDIWKNRYKGKHVSFLGEIYSFWERQ